MISLKQLQAKLLKREKTFKKEHSSLNMNFYWQLAVFIVFVMIPFLFFLTYQFFMDINQEYIPSTESTTGQTIIRKERINKALDYFSIRKQKSTQIKSSPTPIVDPSL